MTPARTRNDRIGDTTGLTERDRTRLADLETRLALHTGRRDVGRSDAAGADLAQLSSRRVRPVSTDREARP